MRTVPFRDVLYGVATRMGLEPGANLQLNQATAITEYIADRLQKTWEAYDWPEWTVAELRQYRASWSSATTYGIGAEIYYEAGNAYYRSLQADNTSHAPDNALEPGWWGAATDLETYIAFDQSWEPTAINIVWNVWADDPRSSDRPREVSWWLTPEGIAVAAGGATRVYVEFGLVPPRFTTVAWDAAAAYLPGSLVYYEGDCYEALEANTGVTPLGATEWERQDFPAILARHVKLAAIGDALREDENPNKAVAWDAQADLELSDAFDRATNQRRAPRGFEVRGR